MQSAFGVDHGENVTKSLAGLGETVARGTRRAGIKTMRAGNKRGYVRGTAASVPRSGASGAAGRAVSQGGRKLIAASGAMNRNTEATGLAATAAGVGVTAGSGTALVRRRSSN